MSDVGLNNVIQNRFSMKLSEGNRKECDSLLTNNFLLVAASLLITLLGCITFVGIWDITEVMNLHLLNRAQANFVFLILVVKVFVGMFSGIENAIYRATHNASISVYMDQIGNLAVALLILGCILLKVPVTIMCVLICLPQLILLIVKHFMQGNTIAIISHFSMPIGLCSRVCCGLLCPSWHSPWAIPLCCKAIHW